MLIFLSLVSIIFSVYYHTVQLESFVGFIMPFSGQWLSIARAVANSTVASSTTVLSTATPTLNGTCPITYAPTPIPIATRTWPQEVICELASRSAEDAYYYIADQCLAGYCSSSLSSAISSFDESDETVMLTQTTVRVDRALYGTGSQSTVVTELLYTTQTVTCKCLRALLVIVLIE